MHPLSPEEPAPKLAERFVRRTCVAVLSLVALAACSSSQDADVVALNDAFLDAATTHDVPRDLLVSLAYSSTRMDGRGGEAAIDDSYGVMGLPMDAVADGPTLTHAAGLIGQTPDALIADAELNIQGAAAELRWRGDAWEEETGLQLDDVSDWAEVVAWYSGSEDGGAQRSYARQVYRWIEGGLSTQAPSGELVVIESREVDVPMLSMVQVAGGTGDYPGTANFVQAHSSNYTNQSRTASDIDMIVVHTAQGSYSGTYNWFQNSAANATAHYVIRSSDGEVTQMVWEEDKAWHAGHSTTNSRSVGIELEGYIDYPGTWYTEAMYRSLADVIVDVADRQGVPLDRAHIIGHNEVPGCAYSGGGASCHTDPGSGFDWDRLMSYVSSASSSGSTGSGSGSSGGSAGSGSGSGGGSSSGSGSSWGTADLVGFVRADSIYASDAPIAGATVVLSTGQTATTDSRGYYEVSGVADGWVDVTVSASGYTSATSGTDVDAGITNWRSVALISSGSSSSGSASGSGSSSSGGVPGVPGSRTPRGWGAVNGPSVTLDWANNGSSSYEVTIYWYDGSDWNTYYGYNTTDSDKTFWPAVDDTWYAWSVRGKNSTGAGEWSPVEYFWFEN